MSGTIHPEPLLERRVIALLEESGALRTGHFILSSGLHSDRYCQCASLFESPARGAELADLFVAQLPREHRPEIVLAPALGGVLWGYDLARAFEVRSMFAERAPGSGGFALRRGFTIPEGSRVLLAEDVVTTGGSVRELIPIVERAGAEVVAIGAVVDRSSGAFPSVCEELGLSFLALCRLDIPTYEAHALPEHLAGLPAVKPGSRAVSTDS